MPLPPQPTHAEKGIQGDWSPWQVQGSALPEREAAPRKPVAQNRKTCPSAPRRAEKIPRGSYRFSEHFLACPGAIGAATNSKRLSKIRQDFCSIYFRMGERRVRLPWEL